MDERDWRSFRGKPHPIYCTCRECQQRRLKNVRSQKPPPVNRPNGWRTRGLRMLIVAMAMLIGVGFGSALPDEYRVVWWDRAVAFWDAGIEYAGGEIDALAHAPPPTGMPYPTQVAIPTPTPYPAAPTLTPPPPNLLHDDAKEYMLVLINLEREKVGAPPLVLGDNHAAQLHAESSLAHCFSGHWGIDGLKPYMRYSLSGGYQSNAENVSGLDYCIRKGDGYSSLSDTASSIREAMSGLVASSDHRRNILKRWHKKVNIGLAWDKYNFYAIQHFEGDYIEYTELPKISAGRLSFRGRVKNGSQFGKGQFFSVVVQHDPPPHELTRGQLSRTYCYASGLPVAFLRKPPPPGSHYSTHVSAKEHQVCPAPYLVAPDAPAPSSPTEAHEYWEEAYKVSQSLASVTIDVPHIDVSTWQVGGDSFSVAADLSDVLATHGPGVYAVVLWGTLGGEVVVISQYAIFHQGGID